MQTDQRQRPPELQQLDVFIGRWMTEGETVAAPAAPAVAIVASDVYQWLPGGRFVMHPAYGRIGTVGVGGVEIIGFDSSHAFALPKVRIGARTTTVPLRYQPKIGEIP